MDHHDYQYLEEKFRDLKTDIRDDISQVCHQVVAIKDTLDDHIKEDKKAWDEVFFVKRFVMASWAIILAWLGYKQSH